MKHLSATVAAIGLTIGTAQLNVAHSSVCSDQIVLTTLSDLYVRDVGLTQEIKEFIIYLSSQVRTDQDRRDFDKINGVVEDWKASVKFNDQDIIMKLKDDGNTTTCKLDNRSGTLVIYSVTPTDNGDNYISIIERTPDKMENTFAALKLQLVMLPFQQLNNKLSQEQQEQKVEKEKRANMIDTSGSCEDANNLKAITGYKVTDVATLSPGFCRAYSMDQECDAYTCHYRRFVKSDYKLTMDGVKLIKGEDSQTPFPGQTVPANMTHDPNDFGSLMTWVGSPPPVYKPQPHYCSPGLKRAAQTRPALGPCL